MFVIRRISVTRIAFYRGIFPVEIDPVGSETLQQILCRHGTIAPSFGRREDAGTRFASAPAANGKDDSQAGTPFLEGDKLRNPNAIPGTTDNEPISIQVEETVIQVRQLFYRVLVNLRCLTVYVRNHRERLALGARVACDNGERGKEGQLTQECDQWTSPCDVVRIRGESLPFSHMVSTLRDKCNGIAERANGPFMFD